MDGMRCMVWGGWDGVRWNGMKLSKISHGCDANEIALSSQLYGTDRTGTHDTDSRELMFLTDNAGTFFLLFSGANSYRFEAASRSAESSCNQVKTSKHGQPETLMFRMVVLRGLLARIQRLRSLP